MSHQQTPPEPRKKRRKFQPDRDHHLKPRRLDFDQVTDQPEVGTQFDFDEVVVEGIDGSGKTTLVKKFKNCPVKFQDRGVLTRLTLVHPDNWPERLPGTSLTESSEPRTLYVLLDVSEKLAELRCSLRAQNGGEPTDEWETPEMLYLFRYRYLQLAAKYGIYVVDTSYLDPDHVFLAVAGILKNEEGMRARYRMPRVDLLTQAEFEQMPLVAEGHSKIVRQYNEQYDLVTYKPTVFSHTHQRAGVIPGTDLARMRMTRDTLQLLHLNQIPHCYLYVGDRYILTRHVPEEQIPPVEVVVKRCFIGTDKYRYYGMKDLKNRWGNPLVAGKVDSLNDPKQAGELGRYQGQGMSSCPSVPPVAVELEQSPIVRFDYRNPNYHPETGQPLGDQAMCDDLANLMVDVEVTKKLVKRTFLVLEKEFRAMDLYLVDLCFMTLTDGSAFYGEISPDCMRLKKMTEDGLDDVSKDTWRAGGSSNLVLAKWQQAAEILHQRVKEIYNEY